MLFIDLNENEKNKENQGFFGDPEILVVGF